MTEATVLSLIPATRAMTGVVKATLADAALALETGNLTIALRDNGPKVNGTLVFIDGKLGKPGDTFNARKAGGAAYGVHTVLGTVLYSIADGVVALSNVNSMIDVDLNTKAAVFQVA